jgi:Protein of unknown function (DUF3147)
MIVQIDSSSLRETRWYEYAFRFMFGGLVTVLAGWIARKFGPVIGGLFLAFPAIFPASATLIEKLERKKKERKGLNGTQRGRDAAALDAAGAAMGSLGLSLFAAFVWIFVLYFRPWLVLIGAAVVWVAASICIWAIGRRL